MSGGAPDAVLGLVRTAGLDLALPLSALREVVPCPARLGELPVACPGLRGVLSLRGTLVPVLDVAEVLGRPHGTAQAPVVVVVASGGRVLGLLVDEVRGMATVPADALAEVTVEGPPLLFDRTFPDPATGEVVSLLEPERLLALPGVPVVLEPERQTVAQERRARTAGRRSLTLVRCGAYVLALDVAHVHSTVPSPPLRPSAADGPTCLGVTPVAGAEVAVVDLLALLGLGSLQGSALDCGLVLDLPDGQVVLGVGAMVGLHDVPEDAVVPLPDVGSPCPELLPHLVDVDGVGACLLLDGERLLAAPDVVTLSRLTTETGEEDAASGGPAVVVGGVPHLAYSAGLPLASALEQVVEVLAYPEDLVPSSGAAEVLGVTLHRGTALPVVDLAAVLGRPCPPHGPSSRLLLTVVDGQAVTYAVSSLQAILPATWTDRTARTEGSLLQTCPLVQLAGSDALLPVLDLHALTRTLRGDPQVPAPRAGQVEAPALA